MLDQSLSTTICQIQSRHKNNKQANSCSFSLCWILGKLATFLNTYHPVLNITDSYISAWKRHRIKSDSFYFWTKVKEQTQQTAVVSKYELDVLRRLEDEAVTWSHSICDSQIWVNICLLESISALPEEAEALVRVSGCSATFCNCWLSMYECWLRWPGICEYTNQFLLWMMK